MHSFDESACVVDRGLRRALTAHDDIRGLRACDATTAQPVTVGPDATVAYALELMERRPSQSRRCR
jgi:hypothetical protein